jgi:short-subunit dehydrogenase
MVVLITGAAGGMGFRLAKHYASEGHTLVLVDKDAERLAESARSLGLPETRLYLHGVDVSRMEQVDALATDVRSTVGDVDLLVHIAGISHLGDFLDTPIEDIELQMRVNYLGTVYVDRAFLPAMVLRGSGHLVNMASMAGLTAMPIGAAYSASKHAVVGLSEAIRAEVKGRGVDISVICPFNVQTPIFDTIRYHGYSQGFADSQYGMGLDPDKAVKTILDGIRKGKFLIIVGTAGKAAYFAKRSSLRLALLLGRLLYRSNQKYKTGCC